MILSKLLEKKNSRSSKLIIIKITNEWDNIELEQEINMSYDYASK